LFGPGRTLAVARITCSVRVQREQADLEAARSPASRSFLAMAVPLVATGTRTARRPRTRPSWSSRGRPLSGRQRVGPSRRRDPRPREREARPNTMQTTVDEVLVRAGGRPSLPVGAVVLDRRVPVPGAAADLLHTRLRPAGRAEGNGDSTADLLELRGGHLWHSSRPGQALSTALGTVLLPLPPQADSASSQIIGRATAGRDTNSYIITSAPDEIAIQNGVSHVSLAAYPDRRPGLRAADRAPGTRRHRAAVAQEPADAGGGPRRADL